MAQCTSAPEWQSKNEALITKYDLTKRELSETPEALVEPDLEPGAVISLDSIPKLQLHPDVHATISWGSGVMISTLELAPNAEIPEEVLPADRFVFVLEGSIRQLVNGSHATMVSLEREEPDGIHSATPKTDFLYLEKGSKNGVIAGASGAKLLEVYSPLRPDYLRIAGINDIPDGEQGLESSSEVNIEPNKVYDLYDFQRTKLGDGAYSIILSVNRMQLSFV